MARNLVRSSPFGELSRFDPFRSDPMRTIEDWMREFSMLPAMRGLETEPSIRLDVQETDSAYLVKADVPGVKKEDIRVGVEGNTVTIEAESAEEKEEKQAGKVVRRERFFGQQYRSFSLPQEIDDQGAEAHYENGVLSLSLPKKSSGGSKTLSIK